MVTKRDCLGTLMINLQVALSIVESAMANSPNSYIEDDVPDLSIKYLEDDIIDFVAVVKKQQSKRRKSA